MELKNSGTKCLGRHAEDCNEVAAPSRAAQLCGSKVPSTQENTSALDGMTPKELAR
jgi:hypothetical protein